MDENIGTPAGLLDYLQAEFDLENDAAVARKLHVAPPAISLLRRSRRPLGATMVLNIHDTFGVPVATIRKLSGTAKTA